MKVPQCHCALICPHKSQLVDPELGSDVKTSLVEARSGIPAAEYDWALTMGRKRAQFGILAKGTG